MTSEHIFWLYIVVAVAGIGFFWIRDLCSKKEKEIKSTKPAKVDVYDFLGVDDLPLSKIKDKLSANDSILDVDVDLDPN